MVEELLKEACEAAHVPGAVLAVATGEDLDVYAFGVASAVTGEAMTIDHQFPPMSIAKSMTAALAIESCRRGELSLDAALADVLPSAKSAPLAACVSIDQLLACTGGLDAFHFPDTGSDDDAVVKFADTLTALQLVHEPGARFSYSNTSYSILAAVLEVVTATTYDDLLLDRIFTPLGLTRTGTWYRGEPSAPMEQHITTPDGTALPIGWWRVRSCGGAGAGTVFSTAGDIAQYGRRSQRWHELREPLADFPGPHTEAWGRGWALYGWNADVYGWDGFAPGGRAFLRVLPRHDAAVALFANSARGREVYRRVLPALLQQRFGVTTTPETLPPAAANSSANDAIIGSYRNGGVTATVSQTGDGYLLQDLMGRSMPLMPTTDDGWFSGPPDADYPTVKLDGDEIFYFCSVWRREQRTGDLGAPE